MEVSKHLDAFGAEGLALASAARDAGPEALVPTCPGWRVRDLIRHTGMVHRWATGMVVDEPHLPRGGRRAGAGRDREAVGQRRPARTPGGPRRTSPGAPGRPSPAHA
ncbi:hypothetical protein D7Y56_03435 [Streptomyces sp. S501]|uniref:maleylpyruvate isomerase N-terminal domain-containing protein n=1 Tax=Streptomyces sp. S501 TaxID=2420135 RepID=UPI00106EFF73|nr:maleylpyruvate isomerase N-terminal domain-containing protein [Streptomyces sp. S501]QBR05060.1 hypothetical protein D7Y56_03435 [Streptomyces sp. S501]